MQHVSSYLDSVELFADPCLAYKHPKALERLEAIKRGVKGGYKAMPATKKITRKDQKHDESECTVM